MKYQIHHVSDIGNVVRAVRKQSGVRQDDVAGSVGVSHVYLRDLEHGKETVQMGRALQVLAELGIRMELEIPENAFEYLQNTPQRNAARDERQRLRAPMKSDRLPPVPVKATPAKKAAKKQMAQ